LQWIEHHRIVIPNNSPSVTHAIEAAMDFTSGKKNYHTGKWSSTQWQNRKYALRKFGAYTGGASSSATAAFL